MKLKKWQIFLGICLTVIGAGLQFYTELPIGKLGMAVWVIAFVNFAMSHSGGQQMTLPMAQLNQATRITDLPRITIPLQSQNPSMAFFVLMIFVLPPLWLGSYLMFRAVHEWSIFFLLLNGVVLGFTLLGVLTVVSEMKKDTTPTQHGVLAISPENLHIDFRGQVYSLTWFELRDIVPVRGEHKSAMILVMKIAEQLHQLQIYDYEISAYIGQVIGFLSEYRIKAQGREVVRIT